MRSRKLLAAILTVCLLAFALPAFADYQVGLTHGTDRHRPEFPFAPNNEYQLYSAQNEWEPFQVLIWDDAGISNVNVTVSEFTGPGESITDVELYRVHYIPVYAGEISHQPPDPSRAGFWPDALVPFVDHFDGQVRDGAPFDVQADFVQAAYVDVFIPEGQAPGDYTATVTVTANGRADWVGTVGLTVWGFALPNSMSLVSNYQYSRNDVCNYHTANGATTDCDVIHERFFQEYARHRMSPYRWTTGNPPYTYDDSTNTLTIDWTQWDADHGQYLDGDFYLPGYEFQNIVLPRSFSGVPSGMTQEEWNELHWAAWADHFRQKGWIDKAWCYLPDEPSPDEYPELKAKAESLHRADPDLQPFVTEQYDPGLGDDIDIWCPDEPMFTDSLPWGPYPETYEQLRNQGKKTWWYNCVSATLGFDYANHMVDQESTYMRVWLWLTRRYHFTGILFWRITYLWNSQDVWEDMYADKFLCQGDGTLFYPGIPSKIGGTTDIPLPSLRIKYLREAMEDYEYFHILDLRGDSAWMDDVTRTVAPKTWQWEHDWDALLGWRNKVAMKILGTLDEQPPDAPENLEATGDVRSVALSWTAPDDADLAGFDIWYGIYDGDRFYGGTVDKSTTQANLTGLTAGREHHIRVQAFDENGNRSEDSDAAMATPLDDTDDDDDSGDSESAGLTDDYDRNGVGVEAVEDDSEETGCGGWR